ncbi:hypothetical protein LTR05_006528 [Lithohypha guttulata]|uniref:L-ornithine N(5)-monooxygenase n=1 Tax=Lithohypha guttulata TaxID=1690604 RepID=A0AAN7SVE7_9EURO|nr:hypothetical protein LTR05_006528 [Lithohypha guttulata]
MAQTQPQAQQEGHDVICIGFTPAAISLGITLRESSPSTRILFLEPRSKATWKPLPDLPGHAHTSHNLLSDLVTLENPRSRFTFIQFLHQRKLLIDYTNLGSIQPPRNLFEDYLQWCAKHFQDNVHFGARVLAVEPVYSSRRKIDGWSIFTENGSRKLYTAKQVVFCMSQQPCVVHSSQCMKQLSELTKPERKMVRIAIVGQTQAAAELFNTLYDIRADREVVWLVEQSSLLPYTQSSLDANDGFSQANPDLPPELRRAKANNAKATTTIVKSSLLDHIYENQYAQSIKEPDSSKWKYRIKFNQVITNAETASSGLVNLRHQDKTSNQQVTDDFNMVIAATGFTRASLDNLLPSLSSKRLLDGSSITTNAEYAINLRRGVLEPGAGLWCVGSIGDEDVATGEGAFSIMAERSVRVARSLKACRVVDEAQNSERVQAQL